MGLGPGAGEDLTGRARQAIAQADLVVGYSAYIALIRDAFPNKEMDFHRNEAEEARCRAAVAAAAAERTWRWSVREMPGSTEWRDWCTKWPKSTLPLKLR